MEKPVVAIDGTAASGKGTLARRLAAELGFAYMDSGSLYRLVGLRALTDGLDPANQGDAIKAAQKMCASYSPDQSWNKAIRTDEVGQAASQVAAVPEVRQILLALQRDFAKNPPALQGNIEARGSVIDGRDIGTIVCPNADIKLFITAKPEIRAKRRHKELHSARNPVTYEAVLADMRKRDARDAGRTTAPMKPADDARMIDTSDMTIEEVFAKALDLIKSGLL